MQPDEKTAALPLEYAAEVAMEIQMMRGECCEAASALMAQSPLDEIGLNECVVLEEALAKCQLVLQGAVAKIRRHRGARM